MAEHSTGAKHGVVEDCGVVKCNGLEEQGTGCQVWQDGEVGGRVG